MKEEVIMKDLQSHNSKKVFIAIEFQESIKSYLKEIQTIVVNVSKSGNFTTKDNFHLTLKFIGEVPVKSLEEIQKCINEVALKQTGFNLYLDRLGQFPRGNKSIVWVGLKPNVVLDKLFLALDMKLEKSGFPREERKFTSHITLGRQVVLDEAFSLLSKKATIESLPIVVEKISLMESTRVDEELKYIPLSSSTIV